MTGALVVDFDGVVCDALEECALVTWLGLHGVDPDIPVSKYQRAMPPRFAKKFATVRNFARTLDEFVVAHAGRDLEPRNRIEFDLLLDAFSRDSVKAFVQRANAARKRCRNEEPSFWLALHSLYPGIPDLLQRHAGRVHVITAKDTSSVWSILRHCGLEKTVAQVYGEVSAKDSVMLDLCSANQIDVMQTVFVDDNLANVERVAAVGAQAQWATWGYHTPEDLRKAAASDVRRLTLADLPHLTVQ